MMSRLTWLLVVALVAAEGSTLMSHTSLKAMKQAFVRPESVHEASMAAITKSLATPASALQVLEKRNLTTPVLIEISHSLHGKQSHLRRAPTGIDGARKLLNDMIYKSMEKYDLEINRCAEFYSQQCASMDGARGEIAAANYLAANARTLILDSQSTISKCQADIPTKKLELKQQNLKCKHELQQMQSRLKIINGDIDVLTKILTLTDCKSKAFVQAQKVAMLHCQDPCTEKNFITFNNGDLKQTVDQLQSGVTQRIMQDTFKDLFEGGQSMPYADFLQLQSVPYTQNTMVTVGSPPPPAVEVPSSPCTDPDHGAPSATDKRAAKCTISDSPDCFKLQERFLLIQAGVKDEKSDLLEEIERMERSCKDTVETIESQIQNDKDMLSESETKLADATTKEANSGESARQTAKRHDALNQDMKETMDACTGNYKNYESELCALKKIRGELYKMKKTPLKSAFFQDCVVSKWQPSECTKACTRQGDSGGDQILTRDVMTHPNGGAKCLPLEARKKCNLQPCPVDCKLHAWEGWSKCSAECGGGISQRLRQVERPMKYNGKPCSATSDTKVCNNQACEKDCELSRWSPWSKCSKDCDAGTQKRSKYVRQRPLGAGECPDQWSKRRLQYKECNKQRCQLAANQKTLACKEELDIIFLLDGSGSLGQKGWNAEIKAAQTFVDAFSGSGAKARMAVLLYSGPSTWPGVRKCFARNRKSVDMEKTCKIQWVTHFTKNMAEVKTLITGLKWPKGSTLTSLALLSAATELSNGRADAKSIVVVITDGRPLSYRNTKYASRYLRKKARLIWVPVTRFAPLQKIKQWATRRWQENVVPVRTFRDLEKPELVTHIVANICPKTNR